MIGQFWPGLTCVWKLIAPKSGASVPSTPSRFRFCCATVQSERTNSYSTGMPTSMNGTTTFCWPRGHGHAHENVVRARGPRARRTRRGGRRCRRAFSARLASSLNGSVSLICNVDLGAARGLRSRGARRAGSTAFARTSSGTVGADEGLDLHRPVELQPVQQLLRLRRERTELLAGHVPAGVVPAEDQAQADGDDQPGPSDANACSGRSCSPAASRCANAAAR